MSHALISRVRAILKSSTKHLHCWFQSLWFYPNYLDLKNQNICWDGCPYNQPVICWDFTQRLMDLWKITRICAPLVCGCTTTKYQQIKFLKTTCERTITLLLTMSMRQIWAVSQRYSYRKFSNMENLSWTHLIHQRILTNFELQGISILSGWGTCILITCRCITFISTVIGIIVHAELRGQRRLKLCWSYGFLCMLG